MVNYADTRVSFVTKLYQTCIFNHHVLEIMSERDKVFEKIWTALSPEDWDTIQELEAICYKIARHALTNAQTDDFCSSMKSYYRHKITQDLSASKFFVMKMTKPTCNQTLDSWQRVERKVEDFSENGKKCIARLQEQVKIRLNQEDPEELASVLLDPTTKSSARSLLGKIMYKKTVKVLKKEHQKLYNKMTPKDVVEVEDLETGDKNAVAEKDVDEDDDEVEVLNPF